jgi:adenine-specific DNA-methyltransferase
VAKKKTIAKSVEALRHDDASRRNIPTAEFQAVLDVAQQSPVRVAYERRNRDLDPQLVWRGKDEQDWSDLVVHAPPLYIQEKVHPKVLIDDLLRRSQQGAAAGEPQLDLFADFNGIPKEADRTDFYQHEQNWSNRMILGDSLQVMASLAEREGLRGQVQCIYIDPPYGIKFNSNFQWSTTSRDVKDGNAAHITREPEQVKAFRDTWRDGIHSYLTYLRDRLTVARDLLTDSGSIFVQIGDENVHRVRALMDEVFEERNFCGQISVLKTTSQSGGKIPGVTDFILWYGRQIADTKVRNLFTERAPIENPTERYICVEASLDNLIDLSVDQKTGKKPIPAGRFVKLADPTSQTGSSASRFGFQHWGRTFQPSGVRGWSTGQSGMNRVQRANYFYPIGKNLMWKLYRDWFPYSPLNNVWADIRSFGFAEERVYVVQTAAQIIQRCVLMASDPGDLVLDPTCGAGTTAYVAEQWGRRWITIDTSRVALALARARIMGARYPYYLLADSPEGQLKEAEVSQSSVSSRPARGSIRQGFVYDRAPHVTLKSIANNAEIDVIHEKFQARIEPLREGLNAALKTSWQEWEIPREADPKWPDAARKLHAAWWEGRIARQREIDASIAAKADFEFLYDKPYEDKKRVRVAGPFTVESLSPHRILTVDENDRLVEAGSSAKHAAPDERDFAQMILENLRTAGVQQAHKDDKIDFTALTPWPGQYVCAEGRYLEGEPGSGKEKRAAVFVGPEFGTVGRQDLVLAAREAADAGFDVLISCAFSYEAHTTEFTKLGRVPVLKARMNADLHMAADLKNTGKGNLFVVFGEPDIEVLDAPEGQIRVKLHGVDVFHPTTGEIRSDGAEGIACWFVDTSYNEESFFVRHAYFLGANDPYKSLKTTLKAEVDEDAWASLHSDTSRPFDRPSSGRIAVKVINHLGDEVMKVFKV